MVTLGPKVTGGDGFSGSPVTHTRAHANGLTEQPVTTRHPADLALLCVRRRTHPSTVARMGRQHRSLCPAGLAPISAIQAGRVPAAQNASRTRCAQPVRSAARVVGAGISAAVLQCDWTGAEIAAASSSGRTTAGRKGYPLTLLPMRMDAS